MIIDGEDGITHINIYSKGKTNIGKWFSNFTYAPINTQDGHFNCIEGYWYWLTTKDERFRTLKGWECKVLGKESVDMVTISEASFQEKIKSALDVKVKLKPREVSKISLPLCHYYQYGDKRVDAGYEWIVEHFKNNKTNSMKTRAKFKCTEFVSDGETSRSSFEPVVSGSAENDEFFKYTPGGEINLFVVNPDVAFKEGREYYVDFTEAG